MRPVGAPPYRMTPGMTRRDPRGAERAVCSPGLASSLRPQPPLGRLWRVAEMRRPGLPGVSCSPKETGDRAPPSYGMMSSQYGAGLAIFNS